MTARGAAPGPAALRAVIYGRVQGVAFRAFVSRRAAALGVTGYVRNLPDGEVEVIAEGDRNILEKLLKALKQGPPAARVAKVETRWSVAEGRYQQFSVRFD